MSDASQNDDLVAIEIFRPAAKAAWFRPEIEKLRRPTRQARTRRQRQPAHQPQSVANR